MSYRAAAGAALALASLGTACIPYAVGSTAETIRPSTVVPGLSTYFIPAGIEPQDNDSARSISYWGMDAEARFGLDERSDVGVRIPGGTGFIVNYKRRLGDLPSPGRVGFAAMLGGGIVNAGDHALVEFTLLGSTFQSETLTPYGGLRFMHVVPLTPDAARDRPTVGAFLGFRIGRLDLGVSPELGIYYDHSALGLRQRDVIFVPSFTVHGAELIRALRDAWR